MFHIPCKAVLPYCIRFSAIAVLFISAVPHKRKQHRGGSSPIFFCPHTTCTLCRRIFSLRILVLPQKNRSPHAMCHFPKHISYNPSPCHLNIVAAIAKLILLFFQLFKINKIFENTLPLRVAGNGTKKPVTTYAAPAF